MGETRKRLRRKTAGSPLNYADGLVLKLPSWMPYLCLQNNSFIHRSSPSEFTWVSVKCLRFLCKSMQDAWETYFYVKLHIAVQWIHRFQIVVPAESLTFLRSDDASHRILTYSCRRNGALSHYAVVTLPWKSLLILQQSKLDADGKPSTWFPPGRLVELISFVNIAWSLSFVLSLKMLLARRTLL